MASSAQEMVTSLREMQSLYRNVHAPNTTALRDQVDAQVKNLMSDGSTWAVNEMRHLEETWSQHYTMLSQVVDHFHVTATELDVVVELLIQVMEAL